MSANRQSNRKAFTLVELLVVIIIVAILSALTLAALRTGGVRAKEDATRLTVIKLSDAVMELLEELEDQTFDAELTNEKDLYRQLPDTKSFATHSHPPFGATYSAYAANIGAGTANESAECLYMIVTQTGVSRSVIETLHPGDIGDTDGNGTNEFLDAWGNPISLSFTPPEPPSPRVALTQPRQLPRIWSWGVNGADDGGAGDDIQNIYVPADPTEPGFFMQ